MHGQPTKVVVAERFYFFAFIQRRFASRTNDNKMAKRKERRLFCQMFYLLDGVTKRNEKFGAQRTKEPTLYMFISAFEFVLTLEFAKFLILWNPILFFHYKIGTRTT